ncbi:MAG: hypothetical protein LBF02_01815 [Mycoplasmataceae bacterium]|nr:hypothetical protein [Mycoplasmataceae bacterium]
MSIQKKKIAFLSSLLFFPCVFSFCFTSLTSCAKISERTKTFASLKKLMNTDAFKIYSLQTLNVLNMNVLHKEKTEGSVKDLVDLLASKFLIEVSWEKTILDFFILTEDLEILDLLNTSEENWKELKEKVDKVTSDISNSQKPTSSEIMNNFFARCNNVFGFGEMRLMTNYFDFIKKDIGVNIGNSYNDLVHETIFDELEGSDSLNKLFNVIKSSSFYTNTILKSDVKKEVLYKFVIKFSEFIYLLKQNQHFMELSNSLVNTLQSSIYSRNINLNERITTITYKNAGKNLENAIYKITNETVVSTPYFFNNITTLFSTGGILNHKLNTSTEKWKNLCIALNEFNNAICEIFSPRY